MKLKLLSGGDVSCADNFCPTIYLAEDGDLVIQGFNVDRQTSPDLVDMPPGESAVRIPVGILLQAAESYRHKQ